MEVAAPQVVAKNASKSFVGYLEDIAEKSLALLVTIVCNLE